MAINNISLTWWKYKQWRRHDKMDTFGMLTCKSLYQTQFPTFLNVLLSCYVIQWSMLQPDNIHYWPLVGTLLLLIYIGYFCWTGNFSYVFCTILSVFVPFYADWCILIYTCRPEKNSADDIFNCMFFEKQHILNKCHWWCIVPDDCPPLVQILGPVSISEKTSFRKIS